MIKLWLSYEKQLYLKTVKSPEWISFRDWIFSILWIIHDWKIFSDYGKSWYVTFQAGPPLDRPFFERFDRVRDTSRQGKFF
jgi:hypothetical protein